MNQLNAMRTFCCIVESQGFSAAAERLNTVHSSVSRQLQQLETTLGVRLIHRNTRRLSLTEAGEQYYAACVDILERIDGAAIAVSHQQDRPSGLLRISAPLVVGTLELANWLPAFQERYPDIQVDLSCSDPFVDLVAERFDVAIRICGPLEDSSLVARLLSVSPMVLVASPTYVQRMGLPRAAQDLKAHKLLTYGSSSPWSLQPKEGEAVMVMPDRSFRTDTVTTLYAAAIGGAGIAAVTRATAQEDICRPKCGFSSSSWRSTTAQKPDPEPRARLC
jgi:DNA-binding transcriptional LysR family regulator